MSRLFNHYYIGNEEQHGYDQGYRQRKMEEEWEWFEFEKANELIEEPAPVFVLEDGTDLLRCNEGG